MRTIKIKCFSLVACCAATLALNQFFISAAWADDAATIADLKARLARVEKDISQLTQSDDTDHFEVAGIPLHGFADVGYTRASKRNDADTRLGQAGKGFWANSLDFYLTPQFSDKTKGLVELIFEFLPDGLATDLERIQLGYIFNDQLTVWTGRFHAPYGYWNTGFHHGSEIQTSVTRPRFIDFEDKGGLLPAHVMGAWANGDIHVGKAKLTYDLYVGNGNAIVDVDTASSVRGFLTINNARDSNNNTLIGGNLGYKMGGMMVGVHAFSERVNIIDIVAGDLGEVSVKMTGLYGAYEDDNWETIAEYYHFKNDDLMTTPGVTTSNSSWLGFAQVGHAVGNDWMPYLTRI